MTFPGGLKDSIEYITNDSIRTSPKRGKLIKGGKIKKSIPTIPSKFLTIINDNGDKSGFLKSSKRFQLREDEVPGPGSYIGIIDQDEFLRKVSDSKRGFGNFASKTKRDNLSYVINDSTPGAGTYNVKDKILQPIDFGPSRFFKKPTVEQKHVEARRIDDSNPAPNRYDLSKSNNILFRKNTCSNAAFKSQSKRSNLQITEAIHNPAPGSYNVNENLLHQSSKIPYSSFKSTVKRIYNSYSSLDVTPGPADYRPNEVVDKPISQILPRKHYLAISAPAAPVTTIQLTPGPGAYNVASLNEPNKSYMSNSVFVSCTSRWNNDVFNEANPGPTTYNPMQMSKQSFLYNTSKRWI